MTEEIYGQLMKLADPKYQAFQAKLLPGIDHVLGVRMPQLRKIAKDIEKGDWRVFLKENDRRFYECDMLQGLVTAEARMDWEERLALTREFLPRINNWAVCDGFCSSFKEAKKHKEELWDFLEPCLASDKEYEIRFGVVMLLNYFVEEDYIEKAFSSFDAVTSEAYYVRMAIAWAISVYFVHFQEETLAYLSKNHLDDWTYNKALQKIVESYRVDAETKKRIRGMRRK